MAMNVRFTDEQTAALRARADTEGRSMHQVVTAAVEEYLMRRADGELTLRLAEEGAERFAALLARLGE
ncbi:CopG family transcriptional regulator [Euzebya tangerina]|uniref:CopG family transcriptional regulator n=1 Tax=Euzebya tangerina TaxID=591198 RepID=UPI000E30C9D7|nr:CopG family transcriptional regulator [Euzebya tangerina]